MNSEKAMQMNALKSMSQMLSDNMTLIRTTMANQPQLNLIFHPHFIDWHYIASQLPHHHREFDGFINNFTGFKRGRSSTLPPWQKMRMSNSV